MKFPLAATRQQFGGSGDSNLQRTWVWITPEAGKR